MTTKHVPHKKKSEGDILDNLGALIGAQIKKGMTIFEEIRAESKKKDPEDDEDENFMGYVKTFLDDRSIGSVQYC